MILRLFICIRLVVQTRGKTRIRKFQDTSVHIISCGWSESLGNASLITSVPIIVLAFRLRPPARLGRRVLLDIDGRIVDGGELTSKEKLDSSLTEET